MSGASSSPLGLRKSPVRTACPVLFDVRKVCVADSQAQNETVVPWGAKEAGSCRVGSFWELMRRTVTVVVDVLVYLMPAKKVLLKCTHTYTHTQWELRVVMI